MLLLEVGTEEFFDEREQRFISPSPTILRLEHSLRAVSKWESKWNKPFISDETKTWEETVDYVRCMEMTGNVKPEVYKLLTKSDIEKVNEYIAAKMTATTINRRGPQKPNREKITSELIYFWMVQYGIPFDPCDKWHLNRLLMLIEVASVKTGPQKKMSHKEQMAQQRALNASRQAKLHTRG